MVSTDQRDTTIRDLRDRVAELEETVRQITLSANHSAMVKGELDLLVQGLRDEFAALTNKD